MKKFIIGFIMSLLMALPAFAGRVINTDVVVVGSGIAGSTAAAYAADNGLKTVLIEKLPMLGGVMHFVEGTFGAGTKWQAKEMIGFNEKQAFMTIQEYGHWKGNSALLKRVIDRSGPALEWMESKGIPIVGTQTSRLDGIRSIHLYGTPEGRPGKFYAEKMANIVKSNGGSVFTEMPGKELITDRKGNVTGIWAYDEDEEEKVKINAKAVIMATGSIANAIDLRTEFNPLIPAEIKSINLKTNTGDGVKMGRKIGADLAGMDIIIWEGAVPVNTEYGEMYEKAHMLDAYMALKTQSLWLNKHGERFVNEALSGDFTAVSNSLMMNGNIEIALFDEDTKKDLQYGGGAHTNYFTMYDKGRKLEHLDKVFVDGPKRGFAWKANTIKELAEKVGLDPKVMQAAVDRYNDFARSGEDKDFGKESNRMRPIIKAPFYAIKGINTICDATGGLKINKDAQVVNKQNQPIKGFYAAGATSGGIFGDAYPYVTSGIASGLAVGTGMLAVEHIVEHVFSKKLTNPIVANR